MFTDSMTDAALLFLEKMTKSREHGDITLKCEGKVIKANTFILKERYQLGRDDFYGMFRRAPI